MAENICIKEGGSPSLEGNATPGDVLNGKTFYSNDAGEIQTGTFTSQEKTVTSSVSAQTVTPDSGKYLSKVMVNALTMSGTFTTSTRGTAVDMGASNTYRYVNTNGVTNTNSGTYTYASGSTGGTVDLGTTNTYRYVNAANVYAKGKVDGRALSVRATGSGNYTSNVTVSCAVGDIIVWGYCIAGSSTTDYNLSSYTTGASLIGQFILRNDGPMAKVGVFKATSTSVTLKLPSGRTGYICMKF